MLWKGRQGRPSCKYIAGLRNSKSLEGECLEPSCKAKNPRSLGRHSFFASYCLGLGVLVRLAPSLVAAGIGASQLTLMVS